MGYLDGELHITSVGYSRLVSFGDYSNEQIEATAMVPVGESADDVLGHLKEWVGRHVTDRRAVNEYKQKIEGAQWQLDNINRDIQQATERWERIKVFMESHGVRSLDDLPF